MSTKQQRNAEKARRRSLRNQPKKLKAASQDRRPPTVEDRVKRIPIAKRNILEAFSVHTIGSFRTRRAERKEREWQKQLDAKIEANRALAKKHNAEKAGGVIATPDAGPVTYEQVEVDLTKFTVAQLKALCDDRGIEYKAKDTKSVLLSKLGAEV